MQMDFSEACSSLELVVFADDGVSVHPLPPRGRVAIGRASDNDVRIQHPSVSRRHALLHIDRPIRIEDLGGSNGTCVREPDAPKQSDKTHDLRQLSGQVAEIALGDRITLGSVIVVVRRARQDGAACSSPGEPLEARDVVVRDPTMVALYEEAGLAAQSLISVLLLGETGVGKEMLAQNIHRRSPRARRPFLGLNCAALTESLLESELFGHEKGAFTGAAQARAGLFEAAEGGTVFLDEVGELPMAVQAKLLRVIEERQVLRIGARAPRPIDVRFLSATNRDLEAEVSRGAFRQDLFFRLNALTLTIPPLRERASEIAPLAREFVAKACHGFERRDAPALSDAFVAALMRYPWPGNIRELRNVVERAVVLCRGGSLDPGHLPRKITAGAAAEPALAKPPEGDEAGERERIIAALEACVGNQTRAAELLGISRRTLVTRLEAYNLPRPRKRA
jgi:two-component system, NtrC family, response regulator AtoC